MIPSRVCHADTSGTTGTAALMPQNQKCTRHTGGGTFLKPRYRVCLIEKDHGTRSGAIACDATNVKLDALVIMGRAGILWDVTILGLKCGSLIGCSGNPQALDNLVRMGLRWCPEHSRRSDLGHDSPGEIVSLSFVGSLIV